MHNNERLIARGTHLLLIVLFAACLAIPLSAAAQTLPFSTDPQVLARQRDVYDVVDRYQNALNTKDTDAIVSLFAEDSVAEWNDKVTYATRQQKIDGYNALFKSVNFSTKFAYDAIDVYGDMAIVRTHHHVGASYVERGRKVADHNRELFVLRQTGTQWKIILYMFNRDPKQGEG
ncbi:nuclear transport factor 2 family protein [Burkholderia sp. Ac-20365]|uniref:YybH family protein n=1 Tax=Burkholderia sp. Ac-20365 TaxID=2703897 RepID=UPI00197C7074|nr:nuclear transport factor 2 family protein [Burkholderia sp. Ac-20365]MBN3762086.1 nuclear transport factor 2 family protein [Burkholderia sp. Ac-20365]